MTKTTTKPTTDKEQLDAMRDLIDTLTVRIAEAMADAFENAVFEAA